MEVNPSIRDYIEQFTDESLWQMLDDYENWKEAGTEVAGDSLLREKTRVFCSQLGLPAHYHTDFMPKIAMEIYRHFAMKYQAIVMNT